jgi:Sec-independent protein translocase protein TatA
MDQLSIYLGKVIKKEKRYEDNNNQSEIDTKNSNQSEINTKNSNQSEVNTKNNNQSEDKDQGKPIEWGV